MICLQYYLYFFCKSFGLYIYNQTLIPLYVAIVKFWEYMRGGKSIYKCKTWKNGKSISQNFSVNEIIFCADIIKQDNFNNELS